VAVVWSRRAQQNLAAIFRSIARDDRAAAERWVSRLVATGEGIATFPLSGRVVPEIGRDDVRETFQRTYRIVYLVQAEDIRILTVFEGHRQLRDADVEEGEVE
jgi:plasmid stabilization system protein ParE